MRAGQRKRLVFVPAAVLSLVLLAGWVWFNTVGDEVTDLTGWIGNTSWLLDVTVVDRSRGSERGYVNLDVRVDEVVHDFDVYWWGGGRSSTPELVPGDVLTVELVEPERRSGWQGRSVHMAVQAAGTADELEVGAGSDGSPAYVAVMVFDEDWTMVDAVAGQFEPFSEVYGLYWDGTATAVVDLVEDASVGVAAGNAWAASNQGTEGPGFDRPATPGPLGEWRRANGYEDADKTVPTNAAGEIAGDPYEYCVTTGTTAPDPPNCEGNPDFEWEMTPVYSNHTGEGWLTEGVVLSTDQSKSYVTVGLELADGCGLVSEGVDESDDRVTIGLQYGPIATGADCGGEGEEYARRLGLREPLGDRAVTLGQISN